MNGERVRIILEQGNNFGNNNFNVQSLFRELETLNGNVICIDAFRIN